MTTTTKLQQEIEWLRSLPAYYEYEEGKSALKIRLCRCKWCNEVLELEPTDRLLKGPMSHGGDCPCFYGVEPLDARVLMSSGTGWLVECVCCRTPVQIFRGSYTHEYENFLHYRHDGHPCTRRNRKISTILSR